MIQSTLSDKQKEILNALTQVFLKSGWIDETEYGFEVSENFGIEPNLIFDRKFIKSEKGKTQIKTAVCLEDKNVLLTCFGRIYTNDSVIFYDDEADILPIINKIAALSNYERETAKQLVKDLIAEYEVYSFNGYEGIKRKLENLRGVFRANKI